MSDPVNTGRDTTPHRQILPPTRIDDVAEALLALTREIWVLTDRQLMLEALLTRNGIDVSALDAMEPDEPMQARLTARRQLLIDNVLTALRVK
ncbi:MAG: hypothetical protein Q8R81_08810 [Novosphingobium sp.]|uniref:hypothetical protein n=1 Tax=Novosphingobium sp. TaxID=1874826 RepID=UPI002735B46D|nr:hypothetical protein [Novosphingobium sp.]MDP3550484.1 hypothetical protein [Novosphingobium sp.]